MKTLIYFMATLLLTFSVSSQAKLYSLKFTELQIKNYDQMLSIINEKIANAKAEAIRLQEQDLDEEGDKAALEILREGMQIILSRPDKDNMVAKLFPSIRKELDIYGSSEEVLASISSQALHAIQNEKLPVSERATAVYVLENLMSELKPLIAERAQLRQIIEKIKNSNLEIPDKIKAHRKLTSMDPTPDLSRIAKILLENTKAKPKK